MKFWSQLWVLLLLAGAGFCVIFLLTFLLGRFGWLASQTVFYHVLQWSQTLVVMMAAPLAWSWFFVGRHSRPKSQSWRSMLADLRLSRANVRYMVLAALLMVVVLPLADTIEVACTRMPMPDALREYCWEGYRQNQATLAIVLQVSGFWGGLELFLLMCLGTAIGEEMMFRGAMLNCFLHGGRVGWHASAWMVGLIFALIHFEPMGLVPRWLLGTLFVYFVWWSGSLWPGILAHCINNLVALVSYKLATPEELLSPVKEYSFGPVLTLCSLAATVLLLWRFYQMRVEK